jgi:hypothetical protein
MDQDRTDKKAAYALYILSNIDESNMERYFFLADMMRERNLYFIIRACVFTPSEFERMEMLVKTGITYDIAAFIVFTNLNQEQINIIFKINTFDSSLIQKMIEDSEIYKYRGDGLHHYHEDNEDDEEEEEVEIGIANSPLPTRAVATLSENNLNPAFINTLTGLENGINAHIAFKYFDIWSTPEKIVRFKSLIEQGFAENIAVRIIRSGHDNLFEHIMFFLTKRIEPNIAFLLGDARSSTYIINEHHSMLLARVFEGYIMPSDIDISQIDNMFTTKIHMFKHNISTISHLLQYTPYLEKLLQMGHSFITTFREFLFYTNDPFVYIFNEQVARNFSMVLKNNINIQHAFEKLFNKTVTIKQIETYCMFRSLGINPIIANYIITSRKDTRNDMTWAPYHFYEIKRLISNGIPPNVAQDTIIAFEKMADKSMSDMFMSCIDTFSSLGLNKTITSKDICLFVFIISKSESFEVALEIFKNINPTIRNAITNSINFGWSYLYALKNFKVLS